MGEVLARFGYWDDGGQFPDVGYLPREPAFVEELGDSTDRIISEVSEEFRVDPIWSRCFPRADSLLGC